MIRIESAQLTKKDLDSFIPRDPDTEKHNLELINDMHHTGNTTFYVFKTDTGEVLSIFGTTQSAPGISELWQWPGINYDKHKLTLYKSTLDFIYGYLPKFFDKLIVTISDSDGKMGHKWAIYLGGRPYMVIPKFRLGVDHTLYILDLKKEEDAEWQQDPQ